MGDVTTVTCNACGTDVCLARRSSRGLFLVCECPERGIEVTDAVESNHLFDPFQGHWSFLDD